MDVLVGVEFDRAELIEHRAMRRAEGVLGVVIPGEAADPFECGAGAGVPTAVVALQVPLSPVDWTSKVPLRLIDGKMKKLPA